MNKESNPPPTLNSNKIANQDGEIYHSERITFYNKRVENVYDYFPAPTTIISDGAYGIGSFKNDPETVTKLRQWYEPHVKEWSNKATWNTTLWLWNTEQGWATLHPLLEEYGWEYKSCNIWDKGIAHVSGNSNTQTLSKFPQVTEVCVQYVRSHQALIDSGTKSPQEWIRNEWKRAGLTLQEANEACNVKEAASRKYLTGGDQWYFPPPEKFVDLYQYANIHGKESGKPYLVPNNNQKIKRDLERGNVSELQRGKFDCPSGVTNVWSEKTVSGTERLQTSGETTHPNQKPLSLMEQIITASSDKDDVVWVPFGGLATALVASKTNKRIGIGAEHQEKYFKQAIERLDDTTTEDTELKTTQTKLSL